MSEHTYTLVIRSPEFIDPETNLEIEDGRETHDHAFTDAVARWLGGAISDTEGYLENRLPDGWEVRLEAA